MSESYINELIDLYRKVGLALSEAQNIPLRKDERQVLVKAEKDIEMAKEIFKQFPNSLEDSIKNN